MNDDEPRIAEATQQIVPVKVGQRVDGEIEILTDNGVGSYQAAVVALDVIDPETLERSVLAVAFQPSVFMQLLKVLLTDEQFDGVIFSE